MLPILIADNDENDRLLAQIALRNCCLQNPVFFVKDGVEALDFLCQRRQYTHVPRPGLILLDLHMPRKDGYEVLSEVQASALLLNIPVVVMTGSTCEADRDRAYKLGATGYLVKPISVSGLEKLIRESLPQFSFRIVEAGD